MNETQICHKTVAYMAYNIVSNRNSLKFLLERLWHTKYFAADDYTENTPLKIHFFYMQFPTIYRIAQGVQTKRDIFFSVFL